MAGKTVFVIDADNETEQIIASTLESEGYLVFAVPEADVGAEIAQKVKPSLIFVNPEDTGEKATTLCRMIRSHEALKNVPIILLASRPGGADLGSCGVVDSLLLPVNAEELLEKTEKAVAAKAPVVLRVKEKASANEEAEVKAPAAGPPDSGDRNDAGARSRLWDLSEIAEKEKAEEITSAPQRGWEEDVAYMPEEEAGDGRKSRKLLVALLVMLVAVAGAVGALFYSGLMPGMGPQEKAPVTEQKAVQKPKAPQPAPGAVTQPPAPDKPAAAPSTAPTPPAKEEKTAAKASPAPVPEKAVPSPKSPGKQVYSVQVGVFKNEKNAEAFAKILKEKGYDAFTLKSSIKEKGTMYRVLVGRLDDRPKSRELAAAIGEKEKIKTVIFSE